MKKASTLSLLKSLPNILVGAVIIFSALLSEIAYTQTWFEQTTPYSLSLYSVSAVDNNIVWACGLGSIVIKTTDGGTWTDASGTGMLTMGLYNIWAIDANNALVIGATTLPTSYVYKTTNGGTTWSQVYISVGISMNALQMTSTTDGFMIGGPAGLRWQLWRTVNGGATWDSSGLYVPGTSGNGYYNSLFISGSKYWFGTSNSNIVYSSNSGANWSTQSTTQTSSQAIWFNNANTGLAGGSSSGMDKTTNGGTNWIALTSIPLSGNVTGIAGTGNEWWVTSGGDIFYSSNNGTNWTNQYPTIGGYSDIAIARTGSNIWAVGDGGVVLSQNYPNPFNPSTNIKFDIPKSSNVKINIYNALGKEVTTLVNEKLSTGSYEVNWNASNYPSGVYFYKLITDEFSNTKKMVLLK
jgi:photosystem II stability/assembly factor-like uncharacterized protein